LTAEEIEEEIFNIYMLLLLFFQEKIFIWRTIFSEGGLET
jgi:hypothetical protein